MSDQITIAVDRVRLPCRGMRLSHMVPAPSNPSTSVVEAEAALDEMADKIGLERRWKQHAGTERVHYDVTDRIRGLAIAHGAEPFVTWGSALAQSWAAWMKRQREARR